MDEDFWSEENITKYIQNWKAYRIRVLEYIYMQLVWKEKAVHYVLSKSGSKEDGEEVFHNTIIAFDKNLREGKYAHENKDKFEGYFYGILNYQFLNKLKEQGRQVSIKNKQESFIVEHSQKSATDYNLIDQETGREVYELLSKSSSPRCIEILKLWLFGYSMDEIANQLNLKNRDAAKRRKHKCKEMLKRKLNENPQLSARLKHLLKIRNSHEF